MNFNIDYETTTNRVLVYLEQDDLLIPIEIPKWHFEKWLCKTNKLHCEAIVNGKETTWKNDIEGYYENTEASQVHKDILAYIVSHPIEYKGEIVDSVQSIEKAFFNAKMKRHAIQ